MKPYFEQDGISIYHGDCREVCESINTSDVDLLLTDPPYGISLRANYAETRSASQQRDKRRHAWDSREHDAIDGDDQPFDPSPWLSYPRVMLWGANNYADKLKPQYSWLVWDKKDRRGADNSFSDCELCYCSGVPFESVRIFRHLWCGYQRDSEVGERVLHPTQKPVALMKWCISLAGDGVRLVLDPFMGSGATLRASKDSGIRAIGIELKERYCEIAARRLEQRVLPFTA